MTQQPWPHYWKTILSAAATVAVIAQAIVTEAGKAGADGNITNQEALTILFAVLGTAGVFAKRNSPPA